MGVMEEAAERAGIGAGWLVGAGIAAVALFGPSIMKAMRPAAKQAIKGYMAAKDRAKETLAESSERMQDLYEEARHEYETSHHEEPTPERRETQEVGTSSSSSVRHHHHDEEESS